jgi:tellurite resistance protein TerC
MGTREALGWSVAWVGMTVAFGLGVMHFSGAQRGLEFFTGYVIEKALSVDNLFLFLVIFRAFAVDEAVQHRVLEWGILGALLMRGAMIAAGAELIGRFSWVLYVFGGFLVVAGAHMLFAKRKEPHPERNALSRFASKHLRVTKDYRGASFFVREPTAAQNASPAASVAAPSSGHDFSRAESASSSGDGGFQPSHKPATTHRALAPEESLSPSAPPNSTSSDRAPHAGKLFATPLFLVLLVVEVTDITLAFDSIPAIFGITRDAFIVYTSNVFAILGLRAMYFLLAGLLGRLRFLHAGLSFVLMFIGAKMLAEPWLHVPIHVSLAVVAGILLLALAASLLAPPKPSTT